MAAAQMIAIIENFANLLTPCFKEQNSQKSISNIQHSKNDLLTDIKPNTDNAMKQAALIGMFTLRYISTTVADNAIITSKV